MRYKHTEHTRTHDAGKLSDTQTKAHMKVRHTYGCATAAHKTDKAMAVQLMRTKRTKHQGLSASRTAQSNNDTARNNTSVEQFASLQTAQRNMRGARKTTVTRGKTALQSSAVAATQRYRSALSTGATGTTKASHAEPSLEYTTMTLHAAPSLER